jgi:DcmR-like sensory protein
MEGAWVEFLRAPDEAGHAVQIYAELDELAESVAAYLATGFAIGDPAAVIATAEHHETFSRFVGATGWDAAGLIEAGLLTMLDAEETLGSLLDDGEGISPTLFDEVVAGAIDAIAARFPERRLRVFGEMVDLLTARGRPDIAVALEGMWNDLAATRRFSLLCGYNLDVFDVSTQKGTLPGVCAAHTHVRPAYDMARLDRAVYDALDEVLGSSSARMVHGIVSDEAKEDSAPNSQQMLVWISERMPRHADRVLAVARAKYARPPVAAA